jgi:hypothetical protein
MRRFGSVQVRNAGTVGGNIANGSPIGDMPPALIALGADAGGARDGRRRCRSRTSSSPTASRTAARASIVRGVRVPKPPCRAAFTCYKVSKRFDSRTSPPPCRRLPDRRTGSRRRGADRLRRHGRRRRSGRPRGGRARRPPLDRATWRPRPPPGRRLRSRSDMRASAAYRLKVAQNLLLRRPSTRRHRPSSRNPPALAGRRRMNPRPPADRLAGARAPPRTHDSATSTSPARPSTSTTSPSRRAASTSTSAWQPPARTSPRSTSSRCARRPRRGRRAHRRRHPGHNDISPVGTDDEPVLADRRSAVPRPAPLRRRRQTTSPPAAPPGWPG